MYNLSSSALLEVDVQNDFCPDGALAVKNGNEVIEPLNKLAGLFASRGGIVIATQDWHCKNHISFASSHPGKSPGDVISLPMVKEQILWPDHCVQGSFGAEFHKDLDLDPVNLIIRKGYRHDLDSYSAFLENDGFTETGLEGFLRGLYQNKNKDRDKKEEVVINTVFIGGLATDYCVRYSAMDSIMAGFKTYVIEDAIRGVGNPKGSIEEAIETLKYWGVTFIKTGDLFV